MVTLPPGSRRPTLREVAECAGVSVQTVSNALNHPERLGSETLTRVQEAVERLGYRANDTARALRHGTPVALQIGWVIWGPQGAAALKSPEMAALLAGAVATTQREGLRLNLFEAGPGAQSLFAPMEGPPMMDGAVICVEPSVDFPRELTANSPFPLVLAGRDSDDGCCAYLDEGSAVARWVEELVRFGAERLLYLATPSNKQRQLRRRRGFERGLQAARLRESQCPYWLAEVADLEGQLLASLAAPSRPRALLVEGQALAAQVQTWIERARLRVPDELLVVVIPADGEPLPHATDADRALATASCPWEEVGSAAIEALSAQLRGDDAFPRRQRLEGRPLPGASAAPPAETQQRLTTTGAVLPWAAAKR